MSSQVVRGPVRFEAVRGCGGRLRTWQSPSPSHTRRSRRLLMLPLLSCLWCDQNRGRVYYPKHSGIVPPSSVWLFSWTWHNHHSGSTVFLFSLISNFCWQNVWQSIYYLKIHLGLVVHPGRTDCPSLSFIYVQLCTCSLLQYQLERHKLTFMKQESWP